MAAGELSCSPTVRSLPARCLRTTPRGGKKVAARAGVKQSQVLEGSARRVASLAAVGCPSADQVGVTRSSTPLPGGVQDVQPTRFWCLDGPVQPWCEFEVPLLPLDLANGIETRASWFPGPWVLSPGLHLLHAHGTHPCRAGLHTNGLKWQPSAPKRSISGIEPLLFVFLFPTLFTLHSYTVRPPWRLRCRSPASGYRSHHPHQRKQLTETEARPASDTHTSAGPRPTYARSRPPVLFPMTWV